MVPTRRGSEPGHGSFVPQPYLLHPILPSRGVPNPRAASRFVHESSIVVTRRHAPEPMVGMLGDPIVTVGPKRSSRLNGTIGVALCHPDASKGRAIRVPMSMSSM